MILCAFGGGGTLVRGLRLLDLRFSVRITRQRLELGNVLWLRAIELPTAITYRNVSSRAAQGDRSFQRRIAATDHEHTLTRKILRVVQAVSNFVEAFARHPEPAEVTTFADGHDHPLRLDRSRTIPSEMDRHTVTARLDALGAAVGNLNACVLPLPL